MDKQSAKQRIADETDQISSSQNMMWLLTAIVLVFFAWAYLSELEEVTRASGQVIASSRTQIIQSQDGGILQQLLVGEGDAVAMGQIVATLDKTRIEASYKETRSQVAALYARIARLQAELFNTDPVYHPMLVDYPEFVQNQNKLMVVRRTALDDELNALQRILSLLQEELTLNKQLFKRQDVSKREILILERKAAEHQAKLTNKKNSFIEEVQAELAQAEERLLGTEQMLKKWQHMLTQTEVRSPRKGIVKNLQINTIGGVVKPGEDIMEIVPVDDDLLIEVKVSPMDIAFLRVGMPAAIKIDSYDSSIYGELPGELRFISADTLDKELELGEEPYFRVRVRATDKKFTGKPDQNLDIHPGMTALVEIKTGKRTVLQYLTKPITKTLTQSFGER